MDKTTKLFIRVACGMIIFTGFTITAPSVNKFLDCLFNSYKCRDVTFMRWKYDNWRKNRSKDVEIIPWINK